MKTIEKIKSQINNNPIIIYMKGTPEHPSCGFSSQAVKILSSFGTRFAYIDVLENPDIRTELPNYANWPTFPQLWVSGELIGGCSIIIELFKSGKLKEIINSVNKGNKI